MHSDRAGFPTSGGAASPLPDVAPSSYSRDALDKDLMEGFRKQQQRVNKDKHVEQLALARGLGELAVATLKEGYYTPRKVLPPLRPEERRLFERIDFKNWRGRTQLTLEDATAAGVPPPPPSPPVLNEASLEAAQQEQQLQQQQQAQEVAGATPDVSLSSSEPSLAALRGNCAEDVRDFLHKLRSTTRATASIRDARAEVEDNIEIVEVAVSCQSAPLSFAELLDTAARVLAAMERGDLNEEIVVPCAADLTADEEARTEMDGSIADTGVARASPGPTSATPSRAATPGPTSSSATRVLHGAIEVEAYTRQHLMPRAYRAVTIVHTAEWMLQYTMAYLRTTPAINADEAETRLQLLARCVRMLGDMENFSSVLLSIEAKCEEYAGFAALKDTAEEHLGSLLGDVEESLNAVLAAPFPSRRNRLLLIERGIQKKLQRAMLFLNELDYSWTPHVSFHMEWKMQLLSSCFRRIHVPIAQKYMRCSMGFVDATLHEQVADTRITGRFMGASPVQPKVPRAQQVEYERVTEGLTLQQMGMSVKGVASLVVGEQVCMGARYILRQSTKEFNAAWGFPMDEVSVAPSEEELTEAVAKLAARAKREHVIRSHDEASPPVVTFLTEM